jgi:plastocyanin
MVFIPRVVVVRHGQAVRFDNSDRFNHGVMTASTVKANQMNVVLPHPWAAVSDEQGRFTISDVPPGKYTLWLRHPDTGMQERRAVEVRAGQTTKVEVEWRKTGE